MELPYEAVLPLSPAEAFARLCHFARFYPDLHTAHEAHPPGVEVPLLGQGVAFVVAERFGLERRVYAFRVTRFEPERLGITLEAETTTTIGPLRVRTGLTVDWRIEPAEDGARVIARQTVRLPRPWLAPLLLPPPVRRKLVAHVAEETARAYAIMTAPDWPQAGATSAPEA